jgi:hypothetical protein
MKISIIVCDGTMCCSFFGDINTNEWFPLYIGDVSGYQELAIERSEYKEIIKGVVVFS